MEETPGTSGRPTGVALGIGGGATAMYALLGWLLAVAIWITVSIYAIVKWIGTAPDEPNATVLVVAVVLLVTLFVVLFSVGIGLMGRAMSPARSRRSGRRSKDGRV